MNEKFRQTLFQDRGLILISPDRGLHFKCDRAERIMAARVWPVRINRESIAISRGGGVLVMPLGKLDDYFGIPEKKAGNKDLIDELSFGLETNVRIQKVDNVWCLVLSRFDHKTGQTID